MRTVTGIDVGHDALKIVALREHAGVPELDRVAADPLEELGRLDDGPEKSAALAARAKRLVHGHRVPVRECVTGISGRTTIIRYIQVPPVPPWRLEALMRFEATEQSASSVGEDGPAPDRVFDHRMLDVPDVEGQSTVLLALSQESNVLDRMSILEKAGVEDPDVDLIAMGLYNAYIRGHGFDESDADRNIALIDIGAEEMHVVMVKNGGLVFARHQQGGGRRFTKAIEEARGLSARDAEEYKRTKAHIYADPSEAPSEEARETSEILAREAADLGRAVEATLLYARAQTRIKDIEIDRILISGGASRLPGLRESLAMRFRTEAAELEPFRRISMGEATPETIDFVHRNAAALAVPAGLALSRLHPGGVRLDLRLESAKEARLFAQHGIFLRAAAVVFAVGLVFWIAAAVRNRFVYADAKATAQEQADRDDAASKELSAAEAGNRRLAAEIEALRERLASGEDILRALSQIKKRTPKSIRLVSYSTSEPRALEKIADDEEERATFQTRRRIYLRGYARSRSSLSDAFLEVTRYQNALRELRDLFEEVKQRKLLEARSGGEGAAHVAEFVLELRIAKPK